MRAGGAENVGVNEDGMYWAKMISFIRQEILDYKSELDALAIKRMQMGRKLKQVTDEANHMSELAGDRQQAKRKIVRLLKKEEKVTRAHRHARLLARNYNSLLLMCDRHPPHSKALFDELELKLHQDNHLITEAKKRFKDESCERQACQTDFPYLKRAIRERMALQEEMLLSRRRQYEALQRSNCISAQQQRVSLLNSWAWTGDTPHTRRQKAQAKDQQIEKEGKECEHDLVIGECGGTQGWEEAWALIRASTGIADPDLFVQKHLNCDDLEIQMMELKQVSESRLKDLKKEITALEEELEQTRCNSLSMSGNKEARDLHQRLNKAQARLKRSKERSEAVDELQRETMTGFRHICELLGVPEHEDDIHVPEVVRQLERILDALVDEKDRSVQKQKVGTSEIINGKKGSTGTVAPRGSANSASDGSSELSLEINASGPAEIETALHRFVSPKVRVAQQLIGRHGRSERSQSSPFPEIGSASIEEESAEAYVPNREAVKAKSAKTFRSEQRKQARLQKTLVFV